MDLVGTMQAEDIQAALDRLPHGEGFRFIDRLTRLAPGEAAAGCYQVRGDEAFLAGHFPGEPIMPGVILAEAIAQLAGVAAQPGPGGEPMPGLRLTALRNVKILAAAVPGDRLDIEAEIVGRMGSLVQAEGRVSVGGRLICSAVVALSSGG